jgi:hypothetical protein
MNEFDPSTVQAMTASLHIEYCLPGTSAAQSWSEEHRRRDERKALGVLANLAARGKKIADEVVS